MKKSSQMEGITASQILQSLAKRHQKDAMVAECKNGETWGARDLLKLDAWVLCRTYSPLTTIGYEIKCSRQDFEQDQKWTGYLDLCHYFYFVCPAGLIKAEDLPNRIGILWVSKSGRLHTKRKPQRVDPDVVKLNRLLIYVLMSRCKIVEKMYAATDAEPKSKLQVRREVVERANERKELADFVNGHIREIVEDSLKLSREVGFRESSVKRFEEQLAMLGIKWDSANSNWADTMQVENEIHLLKNRINQHTLRQMKQVGNLLTETVDTIERLRGRNTP